MGDVTRILAGIEQGDPAAAEELLPLVYEELRALAAQRLTHERPGQTLQATALVHEAYLRLVDVAQCQHWNSLLPRKFDSIEEIEWDSLFAPIKMTKWHAVDWET